MSTSTTNLGLTKPAYADTADIAVINSNMDTIDTKFGSFTGSVANINSHLRRYETLGASSEVTDANNTSLYGQYVLNAANCANLPTSIAGVFYHMLFAGVLQIAFQYSSNGFTKTYAREFSNSQWYPWRLITGIEDKTTATMNADATTIINRVTKQSDRVHVEIMCTFPSGKYKPTSAALAALPSGYRPSSTIDCVAHVETNGTTWYTYKATINSSGNIMQGLTANCSGFAIDATFMI